MKRLARLRWLVCVILPFAVHAEDGARALGRLFFSPAERATLDAARQAAAIPPPAVSNEEIPLLPEAAISEIPPAPLPPPMTLNGIVARSGGPATVWVNGTAQDGRNLSVPGGSRVSAVMRSKWRSARGARPGA